MPTDEVAAEYRRAYQDWQKQLSDLHLVLLERQRLHPPKLKALLNRESRAKESYDRARLRLLGIEASDPS